VVFQCSRMEMRSANRSVLGIWNLWPFCFSKFSFRAVNHSVFVIDSFGLMRVLVLYRLV
jgi:hypothetical protein